ncbi:hypothetical protein [Methylobacterium sp. V23]|nr:hypothetical protein [Methylobacterium sp. V23]
MLAAAILMLTAPAAPPVPPSPPKLPPFLIILPDEPRLHATRRPTSPTVH